MKNLKFLFNHIFSNAEILFSIGGCVEPKFLNGFAKNIGARALLGLFFCFDIVPSGPLIGEIAFGVPRFRRPPSVDAVIPLDVKTE